MKAKPDVKPGIPKKQAGKPGLTVYKSKKYPFGFIHIIRSRDTHGNKRISVLIRGKDTKGVAKINQSLTLTPLRWREILPILAEELGGGETDTKRIVKTEVTNG